MDNSDGMWVKIDNESAEQYCHNIQGETWSLVSGREGIMYLQHEVDCPATHAEKDPFNFNMLPSSVTKGFDFGMCQQQSIFASPGSVFGTPSSSGT